MANLALPALGRNIRRLPKRAQIAAAVTVVLALLALSFVLGRVTIGQSGSANSPIPQVVTVQPIQPDQPATRGGVNCHQHEQC